MLAIGYTEHLPLTDPRSLRTLEVPTPVATGHDLLVAVQAVSVNPVDVGVQRGRGRVTTPKILGWDAVGVVQAIGAAVTLFHPGDRVFYAGDFRRPGSDSEFQLVDERLVALAPRNLTDAQAAAMPLTALTAWEALFEQLQIDPHDRTTNRQRTLLIINGAGGVGSVAVQLAHWAGLRVIASASRPETQQWVRDHGADLIVNHRQDLVAEVRRLGISQVDAILGLSDLDGHWDEMATLIAPGGRIAAITENRRPLDLKKLTKKRATFAWEWMYSKSYYQTPDMVTQHEILTQVAQLLGTGTLRSTLTRELTPFTAENLRRAYQLVASNRMIGKVVMHR